MEDLPQKKIRGSLADESGGEEDRKFIEKCPNQHLTYDVLRIIFKHLNGMELSSVSMVCRCDLDYPFSQRKGETDFFYGKGLLLRDEEVNRQPPVHIIRFPGRFT